MRAKDLIASDRGGTSDPYVVVKVGPGGDAAPYFGASMRKLGDWPTHVCVRVCKTNSQIDFAAMLAEFQLILLLLLRNEDTSGVQDSDAGVRRDI